MAGDKLADTPFRQGPFARLLLFPLGVIYRLWTRSIRIRFSSDDQKIYSENSSRPVVILLWHNRLFLAGEWHRRFRAKMNCYGLISGSRDGALLETFFGWAGIRAVRGSSNRRGSQALRDLVKVVKSGNDVGVTPDGSRGPRYEAKPGAILLAKLTKAPILILSFEFGCSIQFKSWDAFVVPLPFSRVTGSVKLLEHKEIFAGRSVDEATLFAQQKLNEMTKD